MKLIAIVVSLIFETTIFEKVTPEVGGTVPDAVVKVPGVEKVVAYAG